MVGTFRSDEVHRRHPLRTLLAELERPVHASDGTRRAARPRSWRSSSRGSSVAPPEELLERLWTRAAGGNPCTARNACRGARRSRRAAGNAARRADAASGAAVRAAQELLRRSPAARRRPLLVARPGRPRGAGLRDALRRRWPPHRRDRDDERYGSATRAARGGRRRTCCRASGPGCTRPWRKGWRSGSRGRRARRPHPPPSAPPLGRGGRPAAGARRRGRAPRLAAERVNALGEASRRSSAGARAWERVPEAGGARRDRRVRAPAPAGDRRGPGRRPDAPGGAASACARAGGRRGESRDRAALHTRAAQPVALERAPSGRLPRGAAGGARPPAGRAECRAGQGPGTALQASDGAVAVR